MRATVDYIDYERGWAFVATDELPSRRVFICTRAFGVHVPMFYQMSRGDRVEFEDDIESTARGLRAHRVTRLFRRAPSTKSSEPRVETQTPER
jgi:hypothetical protein